MKIAVVGPGALGCLVAALLKNKASQDVWLLDKRPDRALEIKGSGIRAEGIGGTYTAKIDVTADAGDIGVADLVIICVKSYSTEDACKSAKDAVGKDTSVLTLQNGIGNVQILNDHFGEERVIAGVTNHGATLLGTGHIRHAGRGDTIIGKADGKRSSALKNISAVLTKSGLNTKVSTDINSVVWSKLVINVGINALTAITRLKNGKLVEYEHSRELLRGAVQEASRIVKRKRVKLAYDDPIQKVEGVAKATGANISSMLQDVLSGKRTEIDFINGAIVRQGKSLGIPTPVNEVLANIVKTIEASYDHANRSA